MAGWLTPPVQLHSSRAFDCMDAMFTDEQCAYYQHPWRFWYQADHVYALPTVAFFLCATGIFIIGHVVSQTLSFQRYRGPPSWQRLLAAIRYLSYRGFHVRALGWNTASVGVLLLGLAGTVFFFCMDLIPQPYYWSSLDWGGSPPLATRSGWMALACMPFVFATASKANWITLVTGVTHEKLHVFHRWISYAFMLLALMHTFPFIVYHIRFHDMVEQVTESSTIFYWTGIVALVFQAWLTFASFGPFRNLGYEFFKAAHFVAAVVFILIFFWHCDYTLTSWDYFIATAAVYVPSLVYSWLRVCFEYGGTQKAQLCVEENGLVRITIPAKFDWLPGQHCFLRFPGFGLHALTSHPFTICSLPSASPDQQSSITFFVRHQSGLTARLYDHAVKRPGIPVSVMVDGPYGGIDPAKYHDSDRVIVVAGGSGVGWTLPFVEQFLRYRSLNNKEKGDLLPETVKAEHVSDRNWISTQSVRLSSLRVILATRETTTGAWFRKAIKDLLPTNSPSNSVTHVDVEVHLTSDAAAYARSHTSSSIHDASDSVGSGSSTEDIKQLQHRDKEVRSKPGILKGVDHPGRPQLPMVIRQEAAEAAETGQSLAVFVCGPVTMQNDIRNAVAAENLKILQKPGNAGGVYLHMEHFSWA